MTVGAYGLMVIDSHPQKWAMRFLELAVGRDGDGRRCDKGTIGMFYFSTALISQLNIYCNELQLPLQH